MVCCFCGERIERKNGDAVAITVNSLWHRGNPTVQGFQAHARCMAGKLDRDIPFDEEMWGREG